MKDHFNCSTSL